MTAHSPTSLLLITVLMLLVLRYLFRSIAGGLFGSTRTWSPFGIGRLVRAFVLIGAFLLIISLGSGLVNNLSSRRGIPTTAPPAAPLPTALPAPPNGLALPIPQIVANWRTHAAAVVTDAALAGPSRIS